MASPQQMQRIGGEVAANAGQTLASAAYGPYRKHWLAGYADGCVTAFAQYSAEHPVFNVKQKVPGSKWTPLDTDFLAAAWDTKLSHVMAARVLGRTPGAIRQRASRMAMRKLCRAAA